MLLNIKQLGDIMKKLFVFAIVLMLSLSLCFAVANSKVLDLRNASLYFKVDDNANGDLDLGTDYTIEAWIYVEPGERTTNERILYSNDWQLYIPSGSGGAGTVTVRANGTNLAQIDMTVNTDDWTHICLMGNSEGWTNNYVDGVSKQNAGVSSITGSNYVSIGSISWTATYNFNGAIDEVRLSNVCRYGRWSFDIDEHTAPHVNDANTMLLYNFDDNAVPPTNNSSKVYTTTNYGITAAQYKNWDDASFEEELPLPITLASFTAEAQNGLVELNWVTASETNNANFIIYRDGVALASIEGAGTSTESNAYSYTDNSVVPGVSYTYVLADIDFANEETRYESHAVRVKVVANQIEEKFILSSAYPNPFNPTTILPLELNESALVHVSLFDLNGKMLKEVLNSELNAGQYDIRVNSDNLSSGTYLLRILVDNSLSVQKITFNK